MCIRDRASTYHFHNQTEDVTFTTPGRYRIAVDAYPYNATTPVTLTIYHGKKPGTAVASLDELVGSFDLVGETPRTVELSRYFQLGDIVVPSVADIDYPAADDPHRYFGRNEFMRDYTGEGIVMQSMTIEGPLYEMWPPASTRTLLTGMTFDDAGHVQLTKAPYEHVVDVVGTFATRAFRRPLEPSELEAYASLARPLLTEGRPFLEALRVSLRAVLSAPPFLYHGGEPGALDDHALATRLAYFLWRLSLIHI